MRSVNLAAIYHMPWLEYRHALTDGRVCLRVRAARGDFERATAHHACGDGGAEPFASAKEVPMERAYRDGMYDTFECAFRPDDPRVKYYFTLYAEGIAVRLDADGARVEDGALQRPDAAFVFAYAYPTDPMPEWARGCVGYQIFPDRFRRASDSPKEKGVEPWTSERYENEYRFGGNLRGIGEAAEYLEQLGVGLVYTNPIFLSDSAHRYNTFDYYQIDPLLGKEDDLRALCDTLHAHGIRLVIDGVFNHSGTGFAPFQDALKKGKRSKYYDWFFFDDSEIGYQTFAYAKYMPKLNLRNEACAQYFLEVGRYWLEEVGVDGWRLDVSPEVWPDFWRRFHAMMKRVKPDSVMVAECWDDSREWITVGDQFDSTMHYVLSRAMWERGGENLTPMAFDERGNMCMTLYPQRTQDVLWNFLGSHDTERFLTRVGNDAAKLRAASFFQMTNPGVPVIYYGDELGMVGKNDPDCRRPMRWQDVETSELLRHYRRLTALRKASPALRIGAFRTLMMREDGLYAFLRIAQGQSALVMMNAGDAPVEGYVELPEALRGKKRLKDALTGAALMVEGERVKVRFAVGEGAVVLYK